MKSATSTLITMLATSKQFVMTETYTFTLADGTTIVYTAGDLPNGFKVSNNEPQAPIL